MADLERLRDWLTDSLQPDRRVIYKRLSANDTGATGAHQVGFYVPNRIAFLIAPELEAATLNPRREIDFELESHGQSARPSLIYYNNALLGGTRNECRMTGFGGTRSAIQDWEATGAVLVVSFDRHGRTARAWLALTLAEEELIQGDLGPAEPGTVGYRGTDESGQISAFDFPVAGRGECAPDRAHLPPGWADRFPDPIELAGEAQRRARVTPGDIDRAFMARHECEYALFRAVERVHLEPRLREGFGSIEEFLATAQSVLQRRKSRAGRSLELQLEHAFRETGVSFSRQPETEPGHRPDFIFPSIGEYHRASRGAPRLTMLAVKSTLRDRWRQVLREADKIDAKHLFTLDEGVSESQMRAMSAEGIVLVVPRAKARSYPVVVRPLLLSLADFVAQVREVDVV